MYLSFSNVLDDGGGEEMGTLKELRRVIYTYQLPTMNVFVTYHKHVLIKQKRHNTAHNIYVLEQ